jgi:hypothetical protein
MVRIRRGPFIEGPFFHRMSSGEDFSLEESYEFDDNDDDASDEFVMDNADFVNSTKSEDSAVIVLELPESFLQLSDSEYLLSTEIEDTEFHIINFPSLLIDEVSTSNDASLLESSPGDSSTSYERLKAAVEDERSTHASFSAAGLSLFNLSTLGSTLGTTTFDDYDVISIGGSAKRVCKKVHLLAIRVIFFVKVVEFRGLLIHVRIWMP